MGFEQNINVDDLKWIVIYLNNDYDIVNLSVC